MQPVDLFSVRCRHSDVRKLLEEVLQVPQRRGLALLGQGLRQVRKAQGGQTHSPQGQESRSAGLLSKLQK